MQGHDTWRDKLDARSYHVECLQCGCTFEATRNDASFCSARCRVAYSKQPQKLTNQLNAIEAFGNSLYGIASKYKRNKRVFEAFMLLAKQINQALAAFETD